MTPIAQIGTLPIASRPVARGMDASTDLDDLRAIPWVFAWGQSRVNLTGWFGLGAGLGRGRGAPGRPGPAPRDGARRGRSSPRCSRTRSCRSRRPTAAIARSATSRAATDADLAAAIRDELARTTSWSSRCPGHANLLDGKPDLQRAIEYRNPYVDALSFLQVRFLHEPATERTERLVQATISGVAAGLQNTG